MISGSAAITFSMDTGFGAVQDTRIGGRDVTTLSYCCLGTARSDMLATLETGQLRAFLFAFEAGRKARSDTIMTSGMGGVAVLYEQSVEFDGSGCAAWND